jgi:hypothetical protein
MIDDSDWTHTVQAKLMLGKDTRSEKGTNPRVRKSMTRVLFIGLLFIGFCKT